MELRNFGRLLTSLILLVFVHDASVAQTNNYSSKLFPTPEVLKSSIEFWKNIYAKYSKRDVVIHDSEDLSVIYTVINIDSLFRGIYISERLQWKKIENIKKEYKAILLKLARRNQLSLESLEGKEKFVASLFGKHLNRQRLRRAARRIRAQTGLKERFKLGLLRSGLYLSKMREVFRKEGLPMELLVLPHVESSFNHNAYSKFGAAGIWQFTRSTGRRYLKINYEVDERLDPIRATEAAAAHLKRNYAALKSWPLAITAYNHGLYGMKRARRRYGNDLGNIVKYYRSRSFGFASRNFYAEFLAALHVSNNYKYYFGDIELYRPRGYATFETPDYVSVTTLTDALNIEVEEFAEFNPALRPPVLQARRRIPKGFKIRIPLQENLDIEQLYAQISPKEKFEDQVRPEWHKVRTGEYLSTIARKYRVPLSDLMALNNISNPHRIYAGQNLQLPSQASRKAGKSKPKIKIEKPTQLAEATDLTKETSASVVDVPSSINLEYSADEISEKGSKSEKERPQGTGKDKLAYLPTRSKPDTDSLSDQQRELKSIKIQNLVTRAQNIEEEMALALPDFYVQLTKSMDVRIVQAPQTEAVRESFRDLDFPQNGQVVVEPDETLGHFADWLGVSTQKIRNINGLSFWEPIRIGQPLWLTFENVTPEEFHRRRIEYHQGIEEDFYNNFSIEGEKLYKIRRGDNIWLICNREVEIPYWLVKKYNPDKDLVHLVAGEEIVIPIVEDRYPKGFLDNES